MNGLRISHRIIFGIIIILIGGILLLNSLEIVDADISFATFWPVILIVFGVVKIINFDESTIVGGILLLLGIFFQLRNFHIPFLENLHLASIFWPIIIILFGLSLIFENRDRSKKKSKNNDYSNESM